jgi:hypothetical protein
MLLKDFCSIEAQQLLHIQSNYGVIVAYVIFMQVRIHMNERATMTWLVSMGPAKLIQISFSPEARAESNHFSGCLTKCNKREYKY